MFDSFLNRTWLNSLLDSSRPVQPVFLSILGHCRNWPHAKAPEQAKNRQQIFSDGLPHAEKQEILLSAPFRCLCTLSINLSLLDRTLVILYTANIFRPDAAAFQNRPGDPRTTA